MEEVRDDLKQLLVISEESVALEKVDGKNWWTEVTRDMVIESGKYLAHCISADLPLGPGIAKQIRAQLGVEGLHTGPVGTCMVHQEQSKAIFNLITKT